MRMVYIPIAIAREQLEIMDELARTRPVADVPLAPLRKILRDELARLDALPYAAPDSEGGEL